MSDPEFTETTEAPQVPQNREAEEATLGSLFIYPETNLPIVAGILVDGSIEFYIHRHRWIFDAMLDLKSRGVGIDLVTVCNELGNHNQLHEVGGAAYLTSLVNQTPYTYNAEHYAQIVHADYIRREHITAANEIARRAYQRIIPILELSTSSTHDLRMLARKVGERNNKNMETAIDLVTETMRERAASPTLPGVPTPLIDLNYMLGGGMKRGKLLEIAGRPGQGKTAFLSQCAYFAATEHHKRVKIFSLEMSFDEITLRMLSQMTGIDSRILESGRLPENMGEIFRQKRDELRSAPMYIDDTPAITPDQIRTGCEKMLADGGLDLVIVDYLKLMSHPTMLRFTKTNEKIDWYARELKSIAREFGIPVLAAHQMNRQIEYRPNDKPRLADLDEGGEKDADIVAFIHKDPNKDYHDFVIAKHRGGPTGEVPAVWRPDYTKFDNAARQRS